MKTTVLFICLLTLSLASCMEEPTQIVEEVPGAQETQSIDTASFVVAITESPVLDPPINKEVIVEEREPAIVQATVKYEKEQLDSMAEIAPLYFSGEYDKLAVEMYFNMSQGTGGKVHLAEDAEAVVSTIYDIIDNYVYAGTDLVIVMDRTYSMWDDIDHVKNSLEVIINKLKKLENVRLGMATFTDLNYHGDYWYYSRDLTVDLEEVRSFMQTTTIMSNTDTPESANDAVMRTLEEMDWMPGNKKVMILIGDAPSQLPPLSNYSLEDIISTCVQDDVAMNIHPVVLKIDKSLKTLEQTAAQDIIVSMYPNPVSAEGTVTFYQEGLHVVEVFDAAQHLVLNGSVHGDKITMNFSELSPGMYMMRVHDKATNNYAAQLFTVAR